MEERLAAYRERKKIQNKKSIAGVLDGENRSESFGLTRKVKVLLAYWRRSESDSQEKLTCDNSRSATETVRNWLSKSWLNNSLLTNILFLKFLLWLVLFGLFVELEFGLVYFVLSMFYWIYEGMRAPKKRQEGEISAYSVFNPGCEAIPGTLTAEQFERELQYKPLSGR
ncbi:SAYSvFN domain-containing protein 1 [Protopterus annectens]|uniref:SAYSvFN domain-containing protein 1 n=1 Tax=Protopterus annectens TaxID=7888 RepID=UPI001CFA099D|nr:SAYSvFN domain-containing protein 1 [Protopterus annectens]